MTGNARTLAWQGAHRLMSQSLHRSTVANLDEITHKHEAIYPDVDAPLGNYILSSRQLNINLLQLPGKHVHDYLT